MARRKIEVKTGEPVETPSEEINFYPENAREINFKQAVDDSTRNHEKDFAANGFVDGEAVEEEVAIEEAADESKTEEETR